MSLFLFTNVLQIHILVYYNKVLKYKDEKIQNIGST